MSKYDLSSLPVVDGNQRLVGRIVFDDVIDVMQEEANEDIFRLAGSDDEELNYTSPFKAAQLRLPWLLITLSSGFVTSYLLKQFMSLSEVVVLSVFVPIIAAMGGGNTGIQSSTLIIRGLALGTVHSSSIRKSIGREVVTGSFMGVICGFLLGIWALVMIILTQASPTIHPLFLAFVVMLSLFSAMTFAALFGAYVPMLLNQAKIDPAVASGPFVTASNDILAITIYYGVTLALLQLYHTLWL